MVSMTVSKNEKARILEAYFEKSISKDEMEFLMKEGIHIPPIDWVYSNEEEQNQFDRKKELLERVFGVKSREIDWVKTD
jgi:hypothetical protein